MSTVNARVQIAAPRQEVWDTVMDPERLGQWVTIHRAVEKVQSPGQPGASMEQVLCMRGVNFRVKWNLVEVEEPSLAQWEGRGPARSKALIRYELSAVDDSHTAFQYTNEFTPPGGMLGNVASRIVVGAASEREANASLQRLKELLERS